MLYHRKASELPGIIEPGATVTHSESPGDRKHAESDSDFQTHLPIASRGPLKMRLETADEIGMPFALRGLERVASEDYWTVPFRFPNSRLLMIFGVARVRLVSIEL